MHCALLASVWPNKQPPLLNTLSTEADVHCAWSAEDSLKQWLPSGKLLLLSHKMSWCALLTAVKNYNKSWKVQAFFFKTETKCSRLHDPRPRPRLSFLSSRRLKTNTLVSRTTSLETRNQNHHLEGNATQAGCSRTLINTFFIRYFERKCLRQWLVINDVTKYLNRHCCIVISW